MNTNRRSHRTVAAACLAAFFAVAPVAFAGAQGAKPPTARIIFLHHSTGGNVWDGGVEDWFAAYNKKAGASYRIDESSFPNDPYPWENYPYDYWFLWVKNAGKDYQGQPTLERLTKDYDVVVWKHCYPGSEIEEDSGSPSVSSSAKSLENYKLQYLALRKKMREFPKTRFVVWTLALELEGQIDAGQAARAAEFAKWVKDVWDEKGDNVFVWDFRALESEGTPYLLKKYAASADDPHPNPAFCKAVAPLFCRRLVDVIEGRGDSGTVTGR